MIEEPIVTSAGTELSSSDHALMRRHAILNPYFLAKAILGYTKITPRAHRALCDTIADDSVRRRVFLMPRGHYKTTLTTVTDTIRLIAKNPNTRILIGNEKAENAEGMLTEIKNQFEQNQLFQKLFPELIPPNMNKTTWSTKQILVPRMATWKEPTVDTIGVGGSKVSMHYDHLKLDDLIGEAAFKSPTTMDDTRGWLNRSVSLLVDSSSRMDLTGTRWTMEDIYVHAINKMGFVPFIRKAVVMGPNGPEPLLLGDGTPDNPGFTMEFFQNIIETDPFQWATQYSNDPYDLLDSDFKQEWLQFYRIAPDGDLRYNDIDGSLCMQPYEDLTFYAHVDPSMGESENADHSAIVVVGVNSRGQVFIVEAWKRRIDPLGLLEKILEIHARYTPRAISIEAVAFQKSLQYFVEREARRRGVYLRIEPYRPGTRQNKSARIRNTLQPYFSTGNVYIQSNQIDLLEEYRAFGRTHPDLMDALAQGPGFWKSPLGEDEMQRFKMIRKEMSAPRGVTGYGI